MDNIKKYDVIIIGTSVAGLTAAKYFREKDKISSLLMISTEGKNVYSRVQIPYILRGDIKYNNIFIKESDFFEVNNIDVQKNTVNKIDFENNIINTDSGEVFKYKKLLISTGRRPFTPKNLNIDSNKIFNLWDLQDLDNLLNIFEKVDSVLIMGSGFIAMQAAWASVVRQKKVKILIRGERIMSKILDLEASKYLEEKVKGYGVEIIKNFNVIKVEDNDELILKTSECSVNGDVLIVGAGTFATTELFKGKIDFDDGIKVNKHIETSIKNVYAAGDVALTNIKNTNRYSSMPLWSNAVYMGKIAGLNLSGEEVEYEGSVRSNVTEIFGVTIISAGESSEDSILYKNNFYILKLFYEDNIFIGFTYVGESDKYHMFGPLIQKLREMIFRNEQIEELENFLNSQVAKSAFIKEANI
jgi:NADPH-dependent 2,4-dienoyl-CoA reductase/sulfur reductase-like enzyme